MKAELTIKEIEKLEAHFYAGLKIAAKLRESIDTHGRVTKKRQAGFEEAKNKRRNTLKKAS